jgi:tape measure domain-containing protein
MAASTAEIRIVADTSQAERALGNLNNTLKGLVTVATVAALSKFADGLTNLQNKLSLVVQEGQNSSDVFNVVAKSAINLGAPLKDVGDLFFRIANNTKDLSLAQTDQIKITETLIKGFQLTGQTMGETQGAIIQLGQAFAQGTLRGDELNSVMEALPMVADALAQKFGVQRGALKALGEQGKISSKDLSDAILASGAAIDQAWGNKLPTITSSFNTLQTALGVAFQKFDEGTGTSSAFALAILKITNAIIDVIDWFQTWGKWIGYTIAAITLIFAPLRIARAAFALLIGPIEWLIGLFTGGAGVIAGFGRAFTALAEYITPIAEPVTALGTKIAGLFGILAAGASAIGLTKLFTGIKDLFSSDKKEAVSKYQEELDKLNKKLGLDTVEASKKAQAASNALTAQQLKDAEAIRKATQARDIELKKIIQGQTDSLALTKFIGDAEAIESTILSTNRSLIKEILNDKGQIIGYTKGLNVEEEKNMRLMLQQLEIAKQQQALRALTAPESTSALTSRAGSMFGQTQGGIQVEAQRQLEAAKLLKDAKLISETEYKDQSILIEQQRTDALISLEQKTAEARLRINGVTNQEIITAVKNQMANVKMIQQGGITGAQGVLGAMDQVFGAMSANNKKAFEIHKKLAIAQAMISTYQAAAAAIAFPPGPPLSFIYVAGAIAAGLAQVAAIRSQEYSGRALGGPVMGNKSYIVGERGPELFTPNTAGQITRNDQLGGSTTNVNFTIVANDTTGFDTLLNSRKGMIKQLISDAMLDKGQRF